MDHLKTGIQFSFAVFPESSALCRARRRIVRRPIVWHDGEGVEFTSFVDLDCRSDRLLDCFGEWLARIASVDQHACDMLQVAGAAVECGQSAIAVGHFRCCDGDGMRQSRRIHCDMALDAGNLLARVVALLTGGVGVLHALCINDQEAGRATASLFGAVLANRFFLAPAPGR